MLSFIFVKLYCPHCLLWSPVLKSRRLKPEPKSILPKILSLILSTPSLVTIIIRRREKKALRGRPGPPWTVLWQMSLSMTKGGHGGAGDQGGEAVAVQHDPSGQGWFGPSHLCSRYRSNIPIPTTTKIMMTTSPMREATIKPRGWGRSWCPWWRTRVLRC